MDAAMVAAVAEALTGLGTIGLAIAAFVQLPLIAKQVSALAEQIKATAELDGKARDRAREWKTLEACQRYDFDPVIEGACQRIAAKFREDIGYKDAVPRDLICLLNYFDGLAIGIEQGLYVEQIIRDHLELIIPPHVANWLASGLVENEGFERLMALAARWNTRPTKYRATT